MFSVYFKEGQTEGAAISPVFFTLFNRAISACADSDRHVRVRLRGFASSSEFQSSSDRKNVELSLERARSIERVLRANPLLEVEIEKWTDGDLEWWEAHEKMQTSAGFLDRYDGQYQLDRGFFNRRVDIIVDDPGACRLDAPS